MRHRRFTLIVLVLLGAAVAGPAASGKPEPAAWDGKSFVAHEWGTFTTLQGSNGVVLEGLQHEERDLPSFVHDLRDVTGITGLSPKMETPVIYFYSPEERRVRVRVDFPRGAVTQWYPAATRVNHVGPTVNGMPQPPAGKAIDNLSNGYILWGHAGDLTILAPKAEGALPPVGANDPWRFSRRVDANTLQTRNWNLARRRAGEGVRVRDMAFEHEKCLFYRGLGDFPLPLEGRILTENATERRYAARVKLDNRNPSEPLRHLFLVWVDSGRCGWMYVPELVGGREFDVTLPLAPVAVATETLVGNLTNALTRTGLYEKEARAMARTWQQGYFQDEGFRVLYVLPKAFIERELPLSIRTLGAAKDAPPIPVVRTFVGRTELLSPQREAEMEQIVADYAHGNESAQAEAQTALERWGRFAIPYLNRVLTLTTDEDVRRAVRERLAALRVAR